MPTPPAVDPARGHRGRGPTRLPAAGREGKAPTWPLASTWDDDEKRRYEAKVWRELWATPQAHAWERLGPGLVREVARYCRLLVDIEWCEGANAALHAQATALADRLGLTPKAMRLLLWEIATDEVAQKRTETSSARGRIAAV